MKNRVHSQRGIYEEKCRRDSALFFTFLSLSKTFLDVFFKEVLKAFPCESIVWKFGILPGTLFLSQSTKSPYCYGKSTRKIGFSIMTASPIQYLSKCKELVAMSALLGFLITYGEA